MKYILTIALAVAGFCVGPMISTSAIAQAPTVVNVHFAPGTTGARYDNTIRGYESVEYMLQAGGGQDMTVVLDTDNASNYFNIWAPGAQQAMFIGSTSGNEFVGKLPESGEYRIQVYLMRNAARREETANYRLDIEIIGGGMQQEAARNPDFADGLSGGPDFWEVTNVPANDTLNVRSGPGTGHDVIGELANGDEARNLGCQMVGQSRWCQIEAGFDQTFVGWVNGRYLRER